MRFDRRHLITPEELRVLLAALPEKGSLQFPVPLNIAEAVAHAVSRSQLTGRPMADLFLVRLLSAWNYSYASLVRFLDTFGVGRIEATPIIAGTDTHLLVAIRAVPNNSFKPKPLRGSA